MNRLLTKRTVSNRVLTYVPDPYKPSRAALTIIGIGIVLTGLTLIIINLHYGVI
jgi:hypothetical protein